MRGKGIHRDPGRPGDHVQQVTCCCDLLDMKW